MKGKVAFVIGATAGYVLGTRAGRARYEQIKRGSQAVWNSAPVQQGVGAVQNLAGKQVDKLKVKAGDAVGNAFARLLGTPGNTTDGSR